MESWSMTWALRNFIAELFMPPGIWVMWVLLILFLVKKHELIKKSLITFGVVMIWATSTNYFALHFTNMAGYWLKWPEPISFEANRLIGTKKPEAIIILGGGRRKGALEVLETYQQQDLTPNSMERLRHGARLAKLTQLPILVTGGAPDRNRPQELAEGQLMQRVLEQELAVSPRWIESQSNTTEENAKLSAQILKKEDIKTIYLVTHFWHMPRAKTQFEKEGLTVIEAPMGFYQKDQFTPLDFFPSNEGSQRTRWIWHELLGSFWYNLKVGY